MEKGREFELYVASLYEALGYRVEHDSRRRGQQVDLIATIHTPGSQPTKLLIECKFREKGTVSNQDVIDFISFAKSLPETDAYTAYIIITNQKFSPAAKEAREMHGRIQLKTIKALESEIMDVTPALARYTLDYRDAPISKQYVPLRAKRVPGIKDEIVEDVEKVLLTESLNDEPMLISLQGDYGAGKTTLLKKIKYELAQMFLGGQTDKRPILFQLKDLSEPPDLDAFISTTLTRELWASIPSSAFWALARDGKLVLLLDGFDEIAAGSTQQSRLDSFKSLAPLLFSGSTAVLSGRPSYFVSSSEYWSIVKDVCSTTDELPSIAHKLDSSEFKYKVSKMYPSNKMKIIGSSQNSILFIDAMSRDQVKAVLATFRTDFRNKLKADPDTILNYLESVYDLQDLMSRPLLLDMVIKTLLSGALDISQKSKQISAAILYDAYTSWSFGFDWDKGIKRKFLNQSERRDFAIAMALSMYDANSLESRYSNIILTIKATFHNNSSLKSKIAQSSLEAVASDLLACSFLTRTADEVFKFVHKSFYEFFVAAYLFNNLSKGIIDHRLREPITGEILYFVGAFAVTDDTLRLMLRITFTTGDQHLTRMGETTPEVLQAFKANVFGMMLFSGEIIGPLTVENIEARLPDVRRSLLKDVTLSCVTFDTMRFLRVVFNNCTLNIAFRSSIVDNFILELCSGTLTLQDFEATEMQAVGAVLTLKGSRYGILKSTFEKCSLTWSTGGVYTNCAFLRSIIRYTNQSGSGRLTLTGCTFEVCAVIASPVGYTSAVRIRHTKFVNCECVCLQIDLADFQSCEFRDCAGFVILVRPNSKSNDEREIFDYESEDTPAEEVEISERSQDPSSFGAEEWNGLVMLMPEHLVMGTVSYNTARSQVKRATNEKVLREFDDMCEEVRKVGIRSGSQSA